MIFMSPETKAAAPSGWWCFSFVYISLPALCKTHDLTQYVWAHGESCCRSRCVHVRWNTRRASKLIYTDLPLARVHLGQTLEGGWRLFRVQMRGSTSLLERSFKFTPPLTPSQGAAICYGLTCCASWTENCVDFILAWPHWANCVWHVLSSSS